MKVGDLVEIQKWCRNKGKRAIVVRAEKWDRDRVYVCFLDGTECGKAMRKNLILVSSS